VAAGVAVTTEAVVLPWVAELTWLCIQSLLSFRVLCQLTGMRSLEQVTQMEHLWLQGSLSPQKLWFFHWSLN
jgi:hypothetical protein